LATLIYPLPRAHWNL